MDLIFGMDVKWKDIHVKLVGQGHKVMGISNMAVLVSEESGTSRTPVRHKT